MAKPRTACVVMPTTTTLVCRECGFTVEVEGPAVERWADSVSHTHGFTTRKSHAGNFRAVPELQLTGSAIPPVPSRVDFTRLPQLPAVEVWPERVKKDKLSISRLP